MQLSTSYVDVLKMFIGRAMLVYELGFPRALCLQETDCWATIDEIRGGSLP
jgi:hypothetical protein